MLFISRDCRALIQEFARLGPQTLHFAVQWDLVLFLGPDISLVAGSPTVSLCYPANYLINFVITTTCDGCDLSMSMSRRDTDFYD